MNDSEIHFVTHNLMIQRNRKLVSSLSKKYRVGYIKSLFKYNQNRLLKTDMVSIFRLCELGLKSLITDTPILLDVLAGVFFPSHLKNYVLDYATPYALELDWLGYHTLSKIVAKQEQCLVKNAVSVLVPNELLEKHARSMGATNVTIVPNYPNYYFRSTTAQKDFRKSVEIPDNSKVAVFTAAGRLEEIYGLTLLLQSWKIVEENHDDSILVIVGPKPDSDVPKSKIISRAKDMQIRNLRVTGWVSNEQLPNWVNIADVCLAPRTVGFPVEWYNDKDSTKLSEYAALAKPIVATGYSFSDQYLLVDQSPEAFADGIMKAFEGRIGTSKPHYWEDTEPLLLKSIEHSLLKSY